MIDEGTEFQRQRDELLEEFDDEFIWLYKLMQRPENRLATEALFNASAEDLNRTYREVPIKPKL